MGSVLASAHVREPESPQHSETRTRAKQTPRTQNKAKNKSKSKKKKINEIAKEKQ